jgi:hypothetical protein
MPSIELQQGVDIQFEVVDSGNTLRVRIPANLFARVSDLLALDGASLIGFDRTASAYGTDTAGEALAEVISYKKGLVSLPQHINFAPANAGADIQLTLPQAIGVASDVAFRGARVNKLGVQGSALTIGAIGAGAGATASAASFNIEGAGWVHRVTLTVTGATSGALQTVADFLFPVAYASVPLVLLIPEGRNASAIQGSIATACAVPSGNVTTTGFRLSSGTTTPLVNGTQYAWNFLVIG